MLKQLNLLKQFGSVAKAQDATDLLSEDLVVVEQRVEPAKRAAQIIHKKLLGCLQSQQGLDAERRTKKLPLMLLSVSMAESLKDFDGESPMRKVLEMCCYMQTLLATTLADFELQLEKEVLEPLSKLSEDDLPEILKNKKQFAKLTMDWLNARNRSQASSGPQAKQDGLREEVEEAWRKLENIKDQYSADLYHFATKEDQYASYFIRLLELQAQYHKTSLGFLEKNISELKENNTQSASRANCSSVRVYGEPLLAHLQDSDRRIALPIQECVQMLLQKGMREEGLFRLAAAASVVKKLKSSLDCGNIDHSEFSTDPHAVAGALKSYLRELPEPLMTFELYNDWFKAAGEKKVSDKLEKLKEVLGMLPPDNYNNLRYLVQFLVRLSEQQAVNKMSPSNIAIVLGPNLLWPRTEGEGLSLDMASASSVQVVCVIEPLIQHAHSLFPEEVDFENPELQGSSAHNPSQSQPFGSSAVDAPAPAPAPTPAPNTTTAPAPASALTPVPNHTPASVPVYVPASVPVYAPASVPVYAPATVLAPVSVHTPPSVPARASVPVRASVPATASVRVCVPTPALIPDTATPSTHSHTESSEPLVTRKGSRDTPITVLTSLKPVQNQDPPLATNLSQTQRTSPPDPANPNQFPCTPETVTPPPKAERTLLLQGKGPELRNHAQCKPKTPPRPSNLRATTRVQLPPPVKSLPPPNRNALPKRGTVKTPSCPPPQPPPANQ